MNWTCRKPTCATRAAVEREQLWSAHRSSCASPLDSHFCVLTWLKNGKILGRELAGDPTGRLRNEGIVTLFSCFSNKLAVLPDILSCAVLLASVTEQDDISANKSTQSAFFKCIPVVCHVHYLYTFCWCMFACRLCASFFVLFDDKTPDFLLIPISRQHARPIYPFARNLINVSGWNHHVRI